MVNYRSLTRYLLIGCAVVRINCANGERHKTELLANEASYGILFYFPFCLFFFFLFCVLIGLNARRKGSFFIRLFWSGFKIMNDSYEENKKVYCSA